MRRYLLATVACGVAIAACTITAAVVLAHLVAGVITDPSERELRHWLWPLAALAVLWTIRALTHWTQARLAQRGATASITELTSRVLRSVTALPPRQLAELRDDAATVVTRGLDGLRPYLTAYLPAVVLATVLTPATVLVIALYDLKSAVVVAIALPLIPLFMVLIGLATAERSTAALAATTTLQARLLDLVAGIPTLRALGRAQGSTRRVAELAAVHRRSTMATLRIAFLSSLVLELLATLGVALVAVGVGLRLAYGDVTLAAGLTALLLAPEVFWPLRRVGVEFHAAAAGKTAADKAFALVDQIPEGSAGLATVIARSATITVDGMSVDGRDGCRPEKFSAVIEPGCVTVFTGPNGAGKSTALQVIIGLQAPTDGRVSVAGIDVADLDQNRWWSQLAWLAQRPVLVPGTVRQNLELFGPLDDLESACCRACFDEILATLPDGLDTMIGRGGTGLSLGQRQRLGLARVLGSSASLLLLDEPTAHLDAVTETRVLEAIVDRARAGDTVVVVGHRDPTLAIADRVVEVGGRAHAIA